MATYEEIRNSAYGKSSKNNLGVLTTDIEDRREIHSILQGVFSIAGRVNPTKFGKTADVVGIAGEWVRPVDAETVVFISDTVGGQIVVVTYDDPLAEDPEPSVYEFGGSFIASPGQTSPPAATATLRFFYSARPDDPVTDDITDDIDPLWPEAYNELLALQYAIYLSRKDGRDDEVAVLTVSRDAWLNRFLGWLRSGTPIERHRFSHRRVHNAEDLIPLLGG